LGISVIAVTMGKSLPSSFVPEKIRDMRSFSLQLPDAASLQRTDAVMRKMDDILAHTHGVQGYDAIVGFSLLSNTSASYTGFYFLQFDPWHEREGFETLRKWFDADSDQKMRAEIPEANWICLRTARHSWSRYSRRLQLLCCRIGLREPFNSFRRLFDKLNQAARKRPEVGSLVATFRPSVHSFLSILTRIEY